MIEKENKLNIGQFISIDELLGLLINLEQTTTQQVAQWLINKGILKKTKSLVLLDGYMLKEYEPRSSDYYQSPIDTMVMIAGGEHDGFFTDIIGFARFRLLMDVKNHGVNIPDEIIKNSVPYISNVCYEDDDNFYKNQCIDLKILMAMNNVVEPRTIQVINDDLKDRAHIEFLDKNNPKYFAKFALLTRIHQEINFVGKFADHKDKTKQDKVKDLLEEYGQDYGCPATSTNINLFSNFIPSRKNAEKALEEAKKRLFSTE